jgi:hypothetical protein
MPLPGSHLDRRADRFLFGSSSRTIELVGILARKFGRTIQRDYIQREKMKIRGQLNEREIIGLNTPVRPLKDALSFSGTIINLLRAELSLGHDLDPGMCLH